MAKKDNDIDEIFERAQKILDKPGRTEKDIRQLNKLIEWMSESVVKDIEKMQRK